MLPETPSFWREKSLTAWLLWPFSLVYFLICFFKTALDKPYHASIPVICIGGVVAGGSGKTPTAHAILKILRDQMGFVNPVILTRGYGGILQGPTLVDLEAHNYMDVGDEALLHGLRAPTIVSKIRVAGLRLAEAMGADIVLLDDGLQNNTIGKTISFAVIDGQYGTGNGFLLPAGPLREPLSKALKKCLAVIQTNGGKPVTAEKPVVKTSLKITSTHDLSRSYFAFAGIGHPEKFKATLEQAGFKLTGFKGFADHHPYGEQDIATMVANAGESLLLTTEKDMVRIPETYRRNVHAVTIDLTFEEPETMLELLKTGLAQ